MIGVVCPQMTLCHLWASYTDDILAPNGPTNDSKTESFVAGTMVH